jgi:hypothetical protein
MFIHQYCRTMEHPTYVLLLRNTLCHCKRQHDAVFVTTNPRETQNQLATTCSECAPDACEWVGLATAGPFDSRARAHQYATDLIKGTRGWASRQTRALFLVETAYYGVPFYNLALDVNDVPLEHEAVKRKRPRRTDFFIREAKL